MLGTWIPVPVVLEVKEATKVEYRLWPDSHTLALDRIYVYRIEAPAPAANGADWIQVGTLESKKPAILVDANGKTVFKVPNHDQWWTGSNGVLFNAGASWEKNGSVWNCEKMICRPWGARFIHPFRNGQVLVSLGEKGITVQAGGGWRDSTRNVTVKIAEDSGITFPLERGTPYAIRSELSPAGDFKFFINNKLVATASITDVLPLSFTEKFEGVNGPMEKGQAAAVIDHAYHLGNSVAGSLSFYPAR